jgi:hypothetical protein
MPTGGIMFAVDISAWLRPDATTSPDRLLCHGCGRGKNCAQMIPGWPYSFVAAPQPGFLTLWTNAGQRAIAHFADGTTSELTDDPQGVVRATDPSGTLSFAIEAVDLVCPVILVRADLCRPTSAWSSRPTGTCTPCWPASPATT